MFASNFDDPNCSRELLVSMIRDLLGNNLRLERELAALTVQRDMSFQQWKMIVTEFQNHGLSYEREFVK